VYACGGEDGADVEGTEGHQELRGNVRFEGGVLESVCRGAGGEGEGEGEEEHG
jgi:hypothetical protein